MEQRHVMNPRPLSEDVANLTRRTAEANAALVRGDIEGYLALIKHARDYTLRTADTRLRHVEPGRDGAVFQVPHV
jgi:hypothetical protein